MTAARTAENLFKRRVPNEDEQVILLNGQVKPGQSYLITREHWGRELPETTGRDLKTCLQEIEASIEKGGPIGMIISPSSLY